MKCAIRNVVAAVLTAAVAFGVSVPAASAASKDKPAHVKSQSEGRQKGKATAAGKKTAAEVKPQAVKQRQLLRLIATSDARLARVVNGELLTGLPQDVIDAVSSNVTTDREALAVIRAAVEAGGQDFRQVLAELRTFRVETYNVVVGVVREAVEVTEEAAANDVALAAFDPSDPAVAEAQAANDAAVVAAQEAVAKALLLTAISPVRDRGPAEADIETARELLEQVGAFLEGRAPVEEPVV